MVDFKKLLNRTPEERAQVEIEVEKARKEWLELHKDDPEIKRMNRLLGEDKND